MKHSQIRWILEKYFKETHSQDLDKIFRKWLLESGNQEEKEAIMQELWTSIDAKADDSTLKDLELLHRRMPEMEMKCTPKVSLLSRIVRIAAVIAIPIICSLATYHYTESYYTKNADFVECYVEYGDQQKITLPDSSKVWINSGTLLIYPKKFTGDTRSIYLNGEAFFSVTKDSKKRFIVRTNHLEVEALGTTFNVQAYPDLPRVTTTLEEGKVRVDVKSKKFKSLTLLPNEQVMYDINTGTLTRKTVDAKRLSLWKEEYLVFQEASFIEILNALEKRFGVIFHYDSAKYDGRSFTLRFAPTETLEETLEILKEVNHDFNYKIKDKSIYVL